MLSGFQPNQSSHVLSRKHLVSVLKQDSKSFETDDIVDFSSYKKGKELLTEKYKITF